MGVTEIFFRDAAAKSVSGSSTQTQPVAADPEILPAAGVDLLDDGVAVHALPLAGDFNATALALGNVGHVHVEKKRLPQPALEDLFRYRAGEFFGQFKVKRLSRLPYGNPHHPFNFPPQRLDFSDQIPSYPRACGERS